MFATIVIGQGRIQTITGEIAPALTLTKAKERAGAEARVSTARRTGTDPKPHPLFLHKPLPLLHRLVLVVLSRGVRDPWEPSLAIPVSLPPPILGLA